MKALLVGLLVGIFSAAEARAEEIEFANGDKLDVSIVEVTETELVADHPQLGRLVIPRSALKPPDSVEAGLFGSRFLRGWKRNLGAGISGSSGNSKDSSFNASLSASRSARTYKGDFKSSFFFASADGERTTNEAFADYQHDFLLSDSNFFVFAQGRYQYDEFQAWRHRASSGTGLGYEIFDTKTSGLSVQVGAGAARTWGSEREWSAEGVFGFKFNWIPLEGHSFTADATYYPEFNDAPEFRLLADAAYTMGITRIEGLSLKTGAKNEYDSGQPDKNNNLKYYGNLVYDF